MSRVISLAGWILVATVATAAQAQFPYEGIVTVESGSLQVRSGDSLDHYRTGVLKRDDRVTVVGEKSGGWLAIKPPEGSFSWISGECVREISSSEIEVTRNDVLVRVGTWFDDRQRDVSQVKVSRGTRLQVLERKTSGQGQLTNVWYKIVPPPGEVRYVKGEFVRAADGRRTIARPETGTTQKRPRPTDVDDEEPKAGTKRPTPRPADEGDEREEPGVAAAPTRQFDNSPRGRLDRAQSAYREMMKKSLIDRDVESVHTLFEQAAKSTQSEADHVIIMQRLEDLDSQAERQEKFAELDRLLRKSKQRDEAILSMTKRKTDSDAESTAESDAAPPSVPRFDGSGVLRKSAVTIDGKPAFILASPYGGIRYYVTSAPGVDLRKYLDQTVAVRGPVNYRNEVRAQHILVRDVTPVEVKR